MGSSERLIRRGGQLELQQLFLGPPINKQLEQAADGAPPIAKALEMEINAQRIEKLNNIKLTE